MPDDMDQGEKGVERSEDFRDQIQIQTFRQIFCPIKK